MLKQIKRQPLIILLLFLSAAYTSCSKKEAEVEKTISNDKWVSYKEKDSLGNRYFVAATKNDKLQIRIENAKGEIIFSEDCPTIEPSEIPVNSKEYVSLALSPPNKYVSANDATLSISLSKKDERYDRQYVQLLANINLETKAFYSKKYKVEKPLDWSYAMFNAGVAQWYQNTILVREGTDEDISVGGFMGLGKRGRQLVCYERDFTVKFIKDIDVSAAYYPGSGGTYIPINNNERIRFGINDGTIARRAILVSIEDQWAGIKPDVWEVDLKKVNSLPVDYRVKITDYNVKGDLVTNSYSIFDATGKLIRNDTGEWDLKTGMPRKR